MPEIDPSFVRHLEWYQDAILYASPDTPSSQRISPIFSSLDHQSWQQPSSFMDYRRPTGPSVSHGLPDLSGIRPATRPHSYHHLADYNRPTEHRVSHGLPNPNWISSATLPSSCQKSQVPYPRGDALREESNTFHATHLEEPELYDSETSGTSEESVIPHTYHTPAWALPNMPTRLPVGGRYKSPSLPSKLLSPFQSTLPNRITKRTRERRLRAPTPHQQAWLDRQVGIQLTKANQQNAPCGQDESPTWAPDSPSWRPQSPSLEPKSPSWAPESPKWELA